jgi:hypothetical protein
VLLGVGFLCGGVGGEGGCEDAEGLLTSDGERRMAGDGTAARAETRGRCMVHMRGKGARKDSCSFFIGQGRERERRPGQLAIDGHGGGRRLYCLHEGKALIRRNGRGIKEGDLSRGFSALYGEN